MDTPERLSKYVVDTEALKRVVEQRGIEYVVQTEKESVENTLRLIVNALEL